MFLSKKQWGLVHLALCGTLVLVALQFLKMTDARLKLSFLDVGQGDAILIQTEDHKNILIDAGAGSAVVDRLGEKLGFFDKSIDLFVMTHPDQDHYAGILDLFGKYEIRRIVMTGVASEGALYRSFLDQVKARAIPVTFAQNNQDLWLGGDAYLDILYPLEGHDFVAKTVKNKNDTSIVTRLVHQGKVVAVITGDAGFPEEREVLLAGQEVQGEILKLGHHGSRASTSDEWLKAVNPKIAVISASSDNKFGHPHPETVERVKNLEARSTAKEGTISITFP
ncbi:MAG: MBL fold metallo-hydrolase [Candidatus Peregrinibacteria bacterium]